MRIRRARRILIIQQYSIEIMETIVGTLIMAIGIALFLLPNQLSSGGFTGISTITYYLFKFPLGTTIFILNIPLFIFAFLKIGKLFFSKAVVGTIALSMFIDIFEGFEPLTNDRFLACIYGGIIVGLGTALVLRGNSSTGGTELLANIIKTFKKNYRTSNLLVLLDTIIIGLNVLFFKEIEIGLYSAITIYIMGKIIDIFFEGIYFTKMMFIVSNKSKEISKKINDIVGRGTTGIYAKGMYTNEDKIMLLCVVSRSEVIIIKQIANKIDPKAFIVISNAREAFGKGFKKE